VRGQKEKHKGKEDLSSLHFPTGKLTTVTGTAGDSLQSVQYFCKKSGVNSQVLPKFSFHEFATLLNGMRTGNLMNFSDGVIKYQDLFIGTGIPTLVNFLVNIPHRSCTIADGAPTCFLTSAK
jgi:hypothetical protein